MITRGYPIQIHGIKKNNRGIEIKKKVEERILQGWTKENQRVYKDIKFIRARWKRWDKDKDRGTIIAKVNTPQLEKRICKEGFIYYEELYLTEQ